MQVVQARFYLPPAVLSRVLALADPVVTCGDDVIRFEVFSSCCSTYARVDLLESALNGERIGRGTTNVDFNAPMRSALARVRDSDSLGLTIGAEGIALARGEDSVFERKVNLPIRWLKGFVEVQAHQSRMTRRLEVPGAEAARFLRALPRGSGPGSAWVVPSGRGLRLSQVGGRSGVKLGGVGRLRVLEGLARHAKMLRVYACDDSGATGWEVVLDEARFHLVLSPEPARGFSGEGQVLQDLAGPSWEQVLPRVRASLRWETRIEAEALGQTFGLEAPEVKAALSALGSRGLVGFDLAEGAYFHRELPFDLSLVESLHPRLKDARELVDQGGILLVSAEGERVEALVPGSEVTHRVVLAEGDTSCTCRWFAKHQNARGPCKHMLAVQVWIDRDREPGDQPS